MLGGAFLLFFSTRYSIFNTVGILRKEKVVSGCLLVCLFPSNPPRPYSLRQVLFFSYCVILRILMALVTVTRSVGLMLEGVRGTGDDERIIPPLFLHRTSLSFKPRRPYFHLSFFSETTDGYKCRAGRLRWWSVFLYLLALSLNSNKSSCILGK